MKCENTRRIKDRVLEGVSATAEEKKLLDEILELTSIQLAKTEKDTIEEIDTESVPSMAAVTASKIEGILISGTLDGESINDTVKSATAKKDGGLEVILANHGKFEFGSAWSSTSYPNKQGKQLQLHDNILKLGSDWDFVKQGKQGYERAAINNINDPKQMMNLAKELADMDSTLDEEYKRDMLKLLETLVNPMEQYIPEMAVFINKEAEKTQGYIEFTPWNKAMYLDVGTKGKSPLEVFIHEVVHAATMLAIDNKDPEVGKAIRELKIVRLQVMQEISVEKLVGKDATDAQKKEAQAVIDYLFDEKNALHEFVAHAATNKMMIDYMKNFKLTKEKEVYPDMMSKFIAKIRELFDIFKNKYLHIQEETNAHAKAIGLIQILAKANNRALEEKRNNLFAKIINPINRAEKVLIDWTYEKAKEKVSSSEMPKVDVVNGSFWSKAAYLGKMVGRSFVDEKSKRILEVVASMSLPFNLGKPERSLATIVQDMSEADDFAYEAERITRLRGQIDQSRDMLEKQILLTFKEHFDRELTQEEQEALTTWLEVDPSSIYGKYTNEDTERLLREPIYRKDEIARIIEELKTKDTERNVNYYKAQAEALGYFMATGIAKPENHLNAWLIANKWGTGEQTETLNKEVYDLIDTLASIYAMDHADSENLNIIANLMNEQSKGMEIFTAYQSAFKEESEKELFNSPMDAIKMIKGYTREINDKDHDLKIGRISDRDRMLQEGYVLKEEVLPYHSDTRVEPLGVYVSSIQIQQGLHASGIQYIDRNRRGTSLTEARMIGGEEAAKRAAAKDIKKIKSEVAEKQEQMFSGLYKLNTEEIFSISPMYDILGRVTDYRYLMSKEKKAEYLKQDRRGMLVLAKMYGTKMSKQESKAFNEKVMEMIYKDAEVNYVEGSLMGLNSKEYVVISKDSPDENIRELWRVLPTNIKIENENGFPIRRDMMNMLLGYREISIGNAWLVKDLPPKARYIARWIEKWWMEIVKIAKVSIIIKVPEVLVSNMLSNFMLSVFTGHSPLAILKLQLQGVKELNEYLAEYKRMLKLDVKVKAGKASTKEINELKLLKGALENNPVSGLIYEGFYMSIVEEMGLEEFNNAGSPFTKITDKLLSKAPGILKNGSNWLWLNDKTSYFKLVNTATQYSDFVARYAQYSLMLKKGINKKDAVRFVNDAYINYNKPNSRLVEWANKMGLVMFTKYFTRIQRAIKYTARKHPLTLLGSLLGFEYILGDIDDITDQSLLVKSPGEVIYDPLSIFAVAATPHGADLVYSVYKEIYG